MTFSQELGNRINSCLAGPLTEATSEKIDKCLDFLRQSEANGESLEAAFLKLEVGELEQDLDDIRYRVYERLGIEQDDEVDDVFADQLMQMI